MGCSSSPGKDATRRLIAMVSLSLLLMSLPIYLTITEAYQQLRREKFAEYEQKAADAHRDIVMNLQSLLTREQYRPVAHYQFSDLTSISSPLTNTDAANRMPGLIGCYEIDPDGAVSTALQNADPIPTDSQSVPSKLSPQLLVSEQVRIELASNTKAGNSISHDDIMIDTRTGPPRLLIGKVSSLQLIRRDPTIVLFRQIETSSGIWRQGCLVQERRMVSALVQKPFFLAAASARVVAELAFDGSPIQVIQRLTSAGFDRYNRGERFVIKNSALPAPFEHYSITYATGRVRLSTGGVALRAQVFLLLLFVPITFALLYRVGARAIALGEERVRFAAIVGHELKTPLASLRLHLEMLVSGMIVDSEKIHGYHERMLTQVDRLVRLAGGSLALAGYAHGAGEECFIEMNVGDVLENCRLLALENATHFDLQLELAFPNEATNDRIVLHRELLRTLFENTFENAAKFSLGVQRISVSTEFVPGGLSISIRDFGAGIGRKEIRHVFRPFYRGQRAASDQVGGLGLGLSIVHSLVLMSKGLVKAKNCKPGFVLEVFLPVQSH